MMLGFKERDFPSFWGCRKNMKQRTLQWCYAFCVKKHRQKGFLFQHIELTWSVSLSEWLLQQILSFFFFLVLPVYCYQPVTLHPHAHMLSHVTPWTAACQAPLSMDFSRQEYWSGLPFPSPGPFLKMIKNSTYLIRLLSGWTVTTYVKHLVNCLVYRKQSR